MTIRTSYRKFKSHGQFTAYRCFRFAILSNPIFLSVLGEIIADCPARNQFCDETDLWLHVTALSHFGMLMVFAPAFAISSCPNEVWFFKTPKPQHKQYNTNTGLPVIAQNHRSFSHSRRSHEIERGSLDPSLWFAFRCSASLQHGA